MGGGKRGGGSGFWLALPCPTPRVPPDIPPLTRKASAVQSCPRPPLPAGEGGGGVVTERPPLDTRLALGPQSHLAFIRLLSLKFTSR